VNKPKLKSVLTDFKVSKSTFLCLSASFCSLLTGQPHQVLAAAESEKPKQKRENIERIINELNAKCQSKSMLDKLKKEPQPDSLFKSDKIDLLAGSDDCPGTDIPINNVFTDNGTTIGANNTVNSIPLSCNGFYTATAGPDVIYRFTLPPLANRGSSCTLTLDPTGANWDPSIYILSTCGNGTTCVRGADSVGTNGTEQITDAQFDAIPAGTYYFFVDSFYASGALSAGTYTLNFNCPVTTAASASVGGKIIGLDGSGISRISIIATNSSGQNYYAVSNSFGFYKFDNLPTGDTYVFQISSKKRQFANPTQVVSINENVTDLNFTAID